MDLFTPRNAARVERAVSAGLGAFGLTCVLLLAAGALFGVGLFAYDTGPAAGRWIAAAALSGNNAAWFAAGAVASLFVAARFRR